MSHSLRPEEFKECERVLLQLISVYPTDTKFSEAYSLLKSKSNKFFNENSTTHIKNEMITSSNTSPNCDSSLSTFSSISNQENSINPKDIRIQFYYLEKSGGKPFVFKYFLNNNNNYLDETLKSFIPKLDEIIIDPKSETLHWNDHKMTFIEFYNYNKKVIDKCKSYYMSKRNLKIENYEAIPNFKSIKLNIEL